MKVTIFWTKLCIIAHGALPCLVFSLSLSPEPTYRRRAGGSHCITSKRGLPAFVHQASAEAIKLAVTRSDTATTACCLESRHEKKRMKERKKGLRPHPPTQLMATVPTPHGLFCLGRKIVEIFSRFPCLQNGLMFIVIGGLMTYDLLARGGKSHLAFMN